ncbi:S41 family peptidase [Pedobacter sp. AJM]|uniref:S41 family peptidase n=1 Tax=Pedobacter sp. AJM TaxID=2003629 RepID=UPI000B4A82F5|nr:S41 family peptidase [Pedobacter sp. AJM]OWK70098.1 hypothetical protein CBW18_14055 [Pedobacter sp. AJM]
MKKLLGFFFLMFTVTCLKAQNCNCGDNFAFLTQRISKNYVGYTDKVTPSNSKQFAKFTDSLQQIANRSNAYQCLSLCREWLDFFKDKHISFGIDFSKFPPDALRIFFSNDEKTSWTESKFKSYLIKNKETLDSIEGIWNYGIYEVGIVEDIKPKQFVAFIVKADSVRWMPQQIKFRLKKNGNKYEPIYYSGADHSEQYPKLSIQRDVLDFGIYGRWTRGPKIKQQSVQVTIKENPPSFTLLDHQTSLVKLPSFKSKYRTQIDSLIIRHKAQLDHCEHLMIDIRDNSGGSTKSFEKLLPYLYTNPIKVDGGVVWATEDNIKDCYDIEYPDISLQSKLNMKKDVKKLREHLGEHYQLYDEEIIKFSRILKYPSRISILINDGTASSAELFLLRAEQSKKVTLYGQNTSGAVDYGEIVSINLPCKFYSLNYPASKSLHSIKRPLDNIGIAPNVSIPESETDWIEFIIKYKSK